MYKKLLHLLIIVTIKCGILVPYVNMEELQFRPLKEFDGQSNLLNKLAAHLLMQINAPNSNKNLYQAAMQAANDVDGTSSTMPIFVGGAPDDKDVPTPSPVNGCAHNANCFVQKWKKK